MKRKIHKSYKCVRQYDSADCLCACLASISWYFGKKIPLENILFNSYIDKDGMNLLEFDIVSKYIGLDAVSMKKTENFDEEKLVLPCIAHVILENNMTHFVVIYKIDKNDVILADPSLGLIKVNRKDFFDSNYSEQSQYIWSGIITFLSPNANFCEIKINKKQNDLLRLMKTQKKNIIKILFLSLLSMSLKVLGTFYFQLIIDLIIPNRWIYSLLLVTLSFILFSLISIVFDKLCVQEALKVSKYINQKLSFEYYKHVMKLPFNFHETKKNGEIISRFQDIDKIQRIFVTGILVLPVNTIFIIVVSILIINKSIKIFSIVIIICVLYVVNILLYSERYEIQNRKQMVEEAKMTSYLVDSFEGIDSIKSCGVENYFIDLISKIITKWQDAILILGNTENNQSAVKTTIAQIGELIILAGGTLEVISGNISVGELITLNILVSYLIAPIKNIIALQPNLQTAKVAWGRLEAVLQVDEEIYGGDCIKGNSALLIDNIHYGYTPYSEVIKGVSLEVNMNDKVAIIGNSGSGKTTLAKLLLKFYTQQSGKIYIGGQDITSLSAEDIRRKIVYVSQEDFIFSGTVKENLSLRNKNVPFEKLLQMSINIGAHEFIKKMQFQYDTVLEDRGANLSKGQRQKLAIVRALVAEPKILILDEATSNLDCESEKKIYEELKNINDMSLIIITHKLDNVIDCDQIYILENGKLIAKGKHQYLLNSNKYYQEYFTERGNNK